MKKLIFPITFAGAIAMALFLWGCYGQTVDSFKTFTFEFPVFFHAEYHNKLTPDTSFDFVNMYEYDQYKDNVDKINKAELLSFNYRIDSMIFRDPVTEQDIVFNPVLHKDLIEFVNIKFYIIFAKPKSPELKGSLDSADYVVDPDREPYLLGEFHNVEVSDYYRYAHHIENIDKTVAKVLEDALQNQPYFYILTEYSKIKNQTAERRIFPYISSRYDLIIRFSVNI